MNKKKRGGEENKAALLKCDIENEQMQIRYSAV